VRQESLDRLDHRHDLRNVVLVDRSVERDPCDIGIGERGGRIRRELQATGRLGGGGTDLPSYYRDHEGFLIAAAIDKYVYVTVMQIVVLQQDAVFQRLAGRACGVDEDRFRSTASAQDGSRRLADIPAGAGLGSSGSFTTALLRALHAHTKGIIHPRDFDAIRSWIHVLEPLTGYQRHKTSKAVGGVYLG
jgi:galactokinase/mevalonate kinase-like predicted kinase